MEIIHLLGFQIIDSVKIGFILSFIFSGFSMFLLGRSLWGDLGGLVSALFYVYAPYRASDVYSRGAVGEFWALVFLPLIFWAILEFIKKEKFKYISFLALSFAGLLLTHNITSLAFTPWAILWGVFLCFFFRKKRLLSKLLLGGLWGFGLASFFILPVIFERHFVHIESMISGYFNYLAHFVSLKQLFFSSFWGYGSSELGPYDDLSFAIGTLHWLFAFLAIIIAFLLRKDDKFSFLVAFFLGAVFFFSAFMTHQRSVFIWNSLPFLSYFQFPWRFLVLVTFSSSILAGLIVGKIKTPEISFLMGFLMVFGVIFLNAFYFRPNEWYDISDKEKLSGALWERQLTTSIFDYLPIFAKSPPVKKAPSFPEIISGEGEVKEFRKGTNWQEGIISAKEEGVEVRLPLFYFPNFKVWVDGRETVIRYDNELGLITFDLPQGEHQFFAKLKNTLVRNLGDIFTLLSILSFGGWMAYEKFYSKT